MSFLPRKPAEFLPNLNDNAKLPSHLIVKVTQHWESQLFLSVITIPWSGFLGEVATWVAPSAANLGNISCMACIVHSAPLCPASSTDGLTMKQLLPVLSREACPTASAGVSVAWK